MANSSSMAPALTKSDPGQADRVSFTTIRAGSHNIHHGRRKNWCLKHCVCSRRLINTLLRQLKCNGVSSLSLISGRSSANGKKLPCHLCLTQLIKEISIRTERVYIVWGKDYKEDFLIPFSSFERKFFSYLI